jgi:hypothetical protein
MSINSTIYQAPVAREEAIKLFISAILAAPESFPKCSSGNDFAENLISGSQKLLDYVQPNSQN